MKIKNLVLLVIVVSLIFINIILVSAACSEFVTIYNPFTGKLDYYCGGNFSGSNISADWFISNGTDVCLEDGTNCPSGIVDKQKTTTGFYLYNDTTIIHFNETQLNDTIDDRASGLGDNASWNESYADTLYAGIEYDYNQTTPAITYSTNTNSSLTVWINAQFVKISNVVSYVGNWTADKINYYTKTQSYNKTEVYNKTELTNGSWTYYSDEDWINKNSTNAFVFNESKLETDYFLASAINVVTGTGAGALADIQTYNRTTYNVTESNSDFELRVNFTGITEFTTLIVRHKNSEDSGHSAVVQIWDYGDSAWEGYGYLSESTTSEIQTFGVYDHTDHISGGVVQVRFYQDEGPPNTAHVQQFDWVGISKGYGTPVGTETDPHSIHKDAINDTQMNYTSGKLNIILSWLEGLFISDSDEGDLNVNSSDNWDDFDVPTDLNQRLTLSQANITDEDWIEDSQLPLENKTISHCSNITGNASDLCTITPGEGADGNASSICADDQALLGNGTCYDTSVFFDDTTITDTSAAVNCSNDQVFLGNGSCYPSWNETYTTGLYQDDVGSDCSAGDFVKGVDDDGTLDCDTPAGGGDITGVLTTGDTYLYNGSASGSPTIRFNETLLNLTIDARDTNDSAALFDMNTTLGIQLLVNNSLNKTTYWDDYGTANATQMENSGGVLNILVSWLMELFYTESEIDTKLAAQDACSEIGGCVQGAYDSQANLTDLLDDNYEPISVHFDANTTLNITCLDNACDWYTNATDSCMYWPSGGKDCGAA